MGPAVTTLLHLRQEGPQVRLLLNRQLHEAPYSTQVDFNAVLDTTLDTAPNNPATKAANFATLKQT